MEEKHIYEGDVSIKSPLMTKLENFWYHYKWHTIISAFVVTIILICSFQMCTRTVYDVHILYAGDFKLLKTSADGDIAPYLGTVSSFERVCDDFDESGSAEVNLLDLFVMTPEQISEFYASGDSSDKEINEIQIRDNTKALETSLLMSNYYVCFLSKELFLKYDELHGGAIFSELEAYTDADGEYEYASSRGIYLSSLDFYEMAYICNLPGDTVVCLRKLSEVSNTFGGSNAEEDFRRSEELLRSILSAE